MTGESNVILSFNIYGHVYIDFVKKNCQLKQHFQYGLNATFSQFQYG